MKIAIDARIINSSTGRYVERLIYYLEQIDTVNEYLVLVPKKDEGFYTPKNPNFKVVVADYDNYSLAEQFGLLSLLNKLKPDLVHFCMPQQPVLYRGKSVTTIHDLTLLKSYNTDKNWLTYHIKQLVGRGVFYYVGHKSKQIITPSQFTKDEFCKFARIPASKATVTYEATDIEHMTSEATPYEPLQGKQFVMYVGNQSDYKNIPRLVRAHQLLRKTNPDLMLALVGKLSGKNGVSLQRNKLWVEEQEFEGVLFTDFVPDEQLVWLYQNTRAYVFPSLMEGFGLPGLEAMACDAPVASSNATCLPEVYGDAAHYFNPYSVDEMAEAIYAVMTDESLRESLINKGKLQAGKYSWRKMAEETLGVYNRVLGV